MFGKNTVVPFDGVAAQNRAVPRENFSLFQKARRLFAREDKLLAAERDVEEEMRALHDMLAPAGAGGRQARHGARLHRDLLDAPAENTVHARVFKEYVDHMMREGWGSAWAESGYGGISADAQVDARRRTDKQVKRVNKVRRRVHKQKVAKKVVGGAYTELEPLRVGWDGHRRVIFPREYR